MLMQLHQYVIRWNPRNSDTPQQFCHFRIARSIRHTALLLKTGKASRLRDIRFYVLNLTLFFFSLLVGKYQVGVYSAEKVWRSTSG